MQNMLLLQVFLLKLILNSLKIPNVTIRIFKRIKKKVFSSTTTSMKLIILSCSLRVLTKF